MLHHMLNDDEEGDIHRMTITEMWEVSKQTGATGGHDRVSLLPLRNTLVGTDDCSEVVGHIDSLRRRKTKTSPSVELIFCREYLWRKVLGTEENSWRGIAAESDRLGVDPVVWARVRKYWVEVYQRMQQRRHP